MLPETVCEWTDPAGTRRLQIWRRADGHFSFAEERFVVEEDDWSGGTMEYWRPNWEDPVGSGIYETEADARADAVRQLPWLAALLR